MWMAPENRWTHLGGNEDEHMVSWHTSDATTRTFPMTYRHQGSLGLKTRGEARDRHLVIVVHLPHQFSPPEC